ncbi:MAG: translocation/assembly module TamB domain-containing protein, partial [Brevinematia bacterium]
MIKIDLNRYLISRILVLTLALILGYICLIFLADQILENNTKLIISKIQEYGINIEFQEIHISPSLEIKIENLKISNEFFFGEIDKTILKIDIRKLILNQIPVNELYISKFNIQLKQCEIKDTNSTPFNFYTILTKTRNLKIFIENTVLSLEKGIFSEENIKITIDKSSVKIENDSSITFNINTSLDVKAKEIAKILSTTANLVGTIKINEVGNIDTLFSIFSLKNIEILGVNLEDIDIKLSLNDKKITGVSISKNYYGHLEILQNLIKLEFSINNIPIQIKNINKIKTIIPEISDIINSLTENIKITLLSTNNNLELYLSSPKFSLMYQKKQNLEILLGEYKNKSKKLLINVNNKIARLAIKNFSLFKDLFNVYLEANLEEGITITKSYLDTKFIKGNILDNLKINRDLITIENTYLNAEIDTTFSKGLIKVKPNILDTVAKNMGLNLSLPTTLIEITPQKVLVYGKNGELSFDIVLYENNIEINNLNIDNLSTSIKGTITISNENFLGNLVLNHNNLTERIRINGNVKRISITSKNYGSITISPEDLSTEINLNNIQIKEVKLRKIYGKIIDEMVLLDCEIEYRNLISKFRISGEVTNLSINNGYIYTENKALELSGKVRIRDGKINGVLEIENSQINFEINSLNEVYVYSRMNRLNLPITILTKVNGFLRVKLDLMESDPLKMVQDIQADILVETESIFRKIKINISNINNSITLNSHLSNYYNTFFINGILDQNNNNITLSISTKERMNRRSKTKELIKVYGKILDESFKGKILFNITDFSGLDEKYEKDIYISRNELILSGEINGINIYKDQNVFRIYYTKNGKTIYEIVGNIDKDNIYGTISGEMGLNILKIPDFIDEIDGKIVFNSVQFSIQKGGLKTSGEAVMYGEVKTIFSKEYFKVPRTKIKFQENNIVIRDAEFKGWQSQLLISCVIFTDKIENPTVNLEISQKQPILYSIIIDKGLKIEGEAQISLNFKGYVSNPTIQGKIKLFKNSKVEYFILQSIPSQNEDWGFNLAQLANWKLWMSFEDSYLESEIINGRIDKAEIEINGNISQKSLSVKGYANLSSGYLKYLNKYFTIDSVDIIFKGEEMDFVPFVRGQTYIYAFDNTTEENIKVIMGISGKATKLVATFSSEPERSTTEIAMLLGLSLKLQDTTKQIVSLIEDIGIYNISSYNIREYTGLDIVSIKLPILSTYLRSLIQPSYSFSSKDIIKGTEIT